MITFGRYSNQNVIDETGIDKQKQKEGILSKEQKHLITLSTLLDP